MLMLTKPVCGSVVEGLEFDSVMQWQTWVSGLVFVLAVESADGMFCGWISS